MYTPGTILRLAREERRLSVSDVKYFVRIRESAIIAMENDQFERFPADYMHTFLPVYTDFLGVSHYKLAEAFKTTLPAHESLTSSLYAKTLQQIAVTQMEEEYNELHPALTARFAKFAAHHAGKALVLLFACVLGWSLMSGGGSAIGTLFASRFVVTPEEMRGTPFVELADAFGKPHVLSATARANKQNKGSSLTNHPSEMQVAGQAPEEQQMKTVHLASLFTVDLAAVQTMAVKHSVAVSYAVGDAIVHAVDDLTPPEPKNVRYDASRRSVSSIASSMLARASEERNTAEQQEISTISEISIEQNRLPASIPQSVHFVNPEYNLKRDAAVLVEGVESVSIRDVLAARKRVTMRLVALRAAMLMTHSLPVVETVELKPAFSLPTAEAPLAEMNSSVAWESRHLTAQNSIIPIDIAKEIIKTAVLPKLPLAQSPQIKVLPE